MPLGDGVGERLGEPPLLDHLLAQPLGLPALRVLLEPPVVLALLDLAEQQRVALHLLGLARQVDEGPHLRPQDRRDDGLEQEVDRAELITLGYLVVALVVRGEEDDRHVPRPLARPDERRGLEPVHPGHLDVEEREGEVLLQQSPEGFDPGGGAHEVLPEVGQHGLEGEQIFRIVVDEENVDLAVAIPHRRRSQLHPRHP